MIERTLTILIGRLLGRGRTRTAAGWGSAGTGSPTAAITPAVGGPHSPDRGATPPAPETPEPHNSSASGAYFDCRELFAHRRLAHALDTGDTEQLLTALDELAEGR